MIAIGKFFRRLSNAELAVVAADDSDDKAKAEAGRAKKEIARRARRRQKRKMKANGLAA